MVKYIIKEDPQQMAIGGIVAITGVWAAMLSLGALGHFLNIPYLFRFNFWNVMLINFILALARSGRTTKWIVEPKYHSKSEQRRHETK